MEQHLAVHVPGSGDGIRQAARALDRFCAERGIPPPARWKLHVILDELLSNLVRHGTQGLEAAEVEVEVLLALGEDRLTMTVVDAGPRFNPLEQPAPRTDLPLDQREPGGLGIVLVRALSEEAAYEWRDGKNRVTLALRIER
jgi:anti-sigma regulatory factor (Ser/Thr protein kinase)